ncbi:MAG TPA: L-threonylcarbamoyladenylate synthase [Polyangia bacterium]|jgi:L-threonylcarbamoyladenylate synthase
MRVITAEELTQSPLLYRDIALALSQDGLACFPAESNYRLAASLHSQDAVMRLMQTKHRAGHHPALIFIAEPKQLDTIVGRVPAAARVLARAFWPGPLTLVLEMNLELPSKVARTLTRATGKVGVRCSAHPIAAHIVREFGGPLLVSSANLERKAGAGSLAQVRKNFQQRIDVCVDAGDLAAGAPSTLVEVTDEGWTIVREGAITKAQIEAALAQN